MVKGQCREPNCTSQEGSTPGCDSTHLELSGTTKGLAIFSDSRATLEAIIKGDTNITSDINVLLESLHCRGKSCLLQWIPAHVNIEGNECADSLAKEGRNDDQLCPTIRLANANSIANYRLLPHHYKTPLIVDFDCSRNLTSIIARLRKGHFKGMKISSDKTRTYIPCKNCTEAQLTPDPIVEFPALTPHIIRLGMVPLASKLHEVLYNAVRRYLWRRFRELTTLSNCPWTRQKNRLR
ncbi:RNase H domain-containing protein [Trichonephila clavipes]|nr:RNase H domain-containing protein [Trichonephila clavipes]